MLENFKKIGHACTLVAVTAVVCALVLKNAPLGVTSEAQRGWADGAMWIYMASYFLAFWAYAKAKGRSGWFGLVLSLISVIGMIVLAKAADLSNGPVDKACAACGGRNFLDAEACRYCGTEKFQAPAVSNS